MKMSLLAPLLFLAACQSTEPAPVVEGELPRARRGLNLLEDQLLREESIDDRIAAARLALRLAAREPTPRERLAAAERGLGHSRRVKELAPKRAEGPYLTAVLLGRRLQNQTVPELSLIKTAQAEAEAAEELDPGLDHAGPLRFLGLLYAKAAPWPVSIGDMEEAEDYLERALDTAPDYPENWLAMAEMLLEDKRAKEARERLERARILLEQGSWSRKERERMEAKLADLTGKLADG